MVLPKYYEGKVMVRTIVSIIYYPVIFVWSIFYFVLMLALWVLTVLFDSERVALHKASNLWAHSIVWLNPLWKLKVYGRENIDKKGRYVITVNHQSMLDIPLMYVLPRLNFKWVAKQAVYKWPLFGAVLWLHGDIVIEEGSVRKAMSFVAKGKERLEHGTSVVIFPEGTRSRDGEIHNYKEGAFLLAKEAGVDILPCVINGVKGFVSGWRVQKATLEVSILPPIPTEEVLAADTRDMMKQVRTVTVDELARLRSK